MKRFTNNTFIIIAVLVLAVVAPVSIAGAYFSDYETCFGTAQINLRGQTEIEEHADDAKKVISIVNTGDSDVIVRVAVFGPDQLIYEFENSDEWYKPAGSDFYYYTKILEANEEHNNATGTITVKLDNIKEDAAMPEFDITVIHECAPVILEDGIVKAPDGWAGMPEIKE